VIISPLDNGTKSHPFPHALVAGVERYPQKVTRRMSKNKQAKKSKVKPFVKQVNCTWTAPYDPKQEQRIERSQGHALIAADTHIMPTRYTIELENLKGTLTQDTFKEVSQREDAKKTVKKAFEERYQSGKNRWFFTPLQF
jgi:large subunit ribosomal protein L27e